MPNPKTRTGKHDNDEGSEKVNIFRLKNSLGYDMEKTEFSELGDRWWSTGS
jgi:hypothetical protein